MSNRTCDTCLHRLWCNIGMHREDQRAFGGEMSDLHDCGQCKFTDGSEVSIRVCSECFDKTSWEPKTSNVQTRKCPLPRIGSKDWAWTWNRKTEKYESEHCKYWLEPSGASDGVAELFEVMFQGEHHPCTVGSYMLLSDAKRFAELLARRDWRKANRHE